MISRKEVTLAVAGVIVLAGSAAFGTLSYTTIGDPAYGEKNQAQILSDIYGGTFTHSGVNYSNNAGIEALRVYDSGDNTNRLNLLTGSSHDIDKIWTDDGVALVTAEAKYAYYTQSFGWNGGGLGTTYHPLLTQTDIGKPGVLININGDFLWGYHPDSTQWWSLDSKNSDGEDHMITYKIEGLKAGPPTVWLIFMEDNPLSNYRTGEGKLCCLPEGDNDYNDFVVELRTAVPEPTTICLLGLGALSLIVKKK
jgi:hypothetical protein